VCYLDILCEGEKEDESGRSMIWFTLWVRLRRRKYISEREREKERDR
jgi:hypothetical protein